MFTSREIASIIWFSVIALWVVLYPKTRATLPQLFKALLHWRVVLAVGLMLLYVVGIVVFLGTIGLWGQEQVKDTAVWFAFAAIPLSFAFSSSKESGNIFTTVLADNLRVILLVEFLIGTYTFPLVLELLLLPVVTFVLLIGILAKADPRLSLVAKASINVQMLIGLGVLCYVFYMAAQDFENLKRLDTFRNFLLTPVLSLLFSPFIYIMAVFAAYELLFVRLKIGPRKDKQVVAYTRRRLIKHLGLDLNKNRLFLKQHAFTLVKLQTKEDVDRLLAV